jgi:2-desacetyl-2-hydroxyethyl bacteriochlorophyllide A dehydrogenase
MKAAMIYGPNDLRIEDVPDPECKPDELILKVHRASICNSTDVHIWDGTFPEAARPPYPHILGHENSGEVVEVGDDLKNVYKVGDRVGFWCKMSGAFAEYNNIKPNNLAITKLSDNVSYEEGSVLEIVGGVLRCIYDSGLRIGEKILILGQGPTGLLFTQIIKMMGISKVYTLDLFENRLNLSRKFGSDFTYNLNGKPHAEVLTELRSKIGQIDMVFDTIGKDLWKMGNTRNIALYMLKRHGKYVAWGHPTELVELDMRRISNEDITLRGFEPGISKSNELIKFGEELMSSKKIDIFDMITHHFSLDKVVDGLNLCKSNHDKVIKVVIDIG